MPVFTLPSLTASSGTAIQQIVPPLAGAIARITSLMYTSAAAAHTITVMRATAKTTADGRAAAAQKVMTLSNVAAMNTVDATSAEGVAIGDYMAWYDDEDKIVFDVVAGISSSAVTMTVNFGNDIPDGSPVWIFGELARASVITFTPPVSLTTTFFLNAQAGIPGQLDSNSRAGDNDPLIISSNNITNAGAMVYISGEYVAATDVTMT